MRRDYERDLEHEQRAGRVMVRINPVSLVARLRDWWRGHKPYVRKFDTPTSEHSRQREIDESVRQVDRYVRETTAALDRRKS